MLNCSKKKFFHQLHIFFQTKVNDGRRLSNWSKEDEAPVRSNDLQ